ncbi:MAG: NAD(P)H-dependent oxidoreductase, partial [Betaproteobacteria bacterium]
MCTNPWRIRTSICTTCTTGTATSAAGTDASRTRTGTSTDGCATGIRIIPTCITATGTSKLAAFATESHVADLKVLGISGSLRKASFNTAALRTCAELMPAGMTMTYARLDDIPIFNQDVFDAGLPESAKRFRAEVAAADGLLIASPEYNFSLSAALKNAIDWGSRPPNQVFQDKPIAIFSA